jgi:cell division protein FtsL
MTPPAAAAAPAVHPRRTVGPGRRTAPPRPRRVSGPARRGIDARPRPAERRADADTGIALGVLAALRGLSRAALLDRLLRGRTWIALVAFALIGIVTLQLGLLELNASIGRTLAKEAALQRENASLSIENSELSAGDRVESRAALLGMELVPLGALRFLAARPGIDASRGAAALSTPVQMSSSGSEAPAGGASSTAPAGASSQAAAAPTSAQAAGAPASGESSSAPAHEASASSGESAGPSAGAIPSSTTPPATPSSTTSSSTTSSTTAPSQAEPAASSSAEASPAGGTQAGPTG